MNQNAQSKRVRLKGCVYSGVGSVYSYQQLYKQSLPIISNVALLSKRSVDSRTMSQEELYNQYHCEFTVKQVTQTPLVEKT